jgi:hypothetical protein
MLIALLYVNASATPMLVLLFVLIHTGVKYCTFIQHFNQVWTIILYHLVLCMWLTDRA